MLPVVVAEVGRRPDVLGTVALLEDGGQRGGSWTFEDRLVRLDHYSFVVGGGVAHGLRLRCRR
jgi:hypothetical protein